MKNPVIAGSNAFALLVVMFVMTTQSFVCAQDVDWRPVIFRGDRQSLRDCVLLNDSTLLAVGDNGVIRRGTVGGVLPAIVGSFGSPTLRTIALGDNHRILACGDDGVTALSSNDGLEWSTLKTDCGTIHDVIHTLTYGFVVAAERGVFRIATDMTVRRIGNFPCNSIAVYNDTLWVSSAAGAVSYSVNGGVSWLEDTRVSGQGPIRAMRTSPKGDLFIVKDRHLVIRPRDGGNLDTLYPLAASFKFKDIAFHGDTVFATSDDEVYGHAYSPDYGQTWNVALSFAIRSASSVATDGYSLACVGESGAFVFTSIKSAINASFAIMGFQPQVVAAETPSIAALSVAGATVYALTSSPSFALLRSDDSIRTELEIGKSVGLVSMNMSAANGHLWITFDSTKSIPIPGGSRQSRRFNALHRRFNDSTWERTESDMWDTPSTSTAVTSDGALLLCSEGMNYLIRIQQGGVKDTVEGIPGTTVDYVCSGPAGVHVVVDQQRLYSSADGGASWQLRSLMLPFRPHAIVSQSAGQVVISRLDVSGTQRTLRLARSLDTGSTWIEYPPTIVAGVLTSVTRLRSFGIDDLLASGRGNTVMLSRNAGNALRELEVPVNNTVTIADAWFLDERTIVVGGTQSTFMIGRLSPSMSVSDADGKGFSELTEMPVREVQVYDLLGRLKMSCITENGTCDVGQVLQEVPQSSQLIVVVIMSNGERRVVKVAR